MRKLLGVFVAVAVLAGVHGGVARAETRPPSNDDQLDAVDVTELPFATSVETRRATLEVGESQPTCRRVRGTVWFRLTAPRDEKVEIVAATTYSGVLAVYRQAETGLEEVACTEALRTRPVEISAGQGAQYLIQLGATDGDGGVADLWVEPARWQERRIQRVEYVRESAEQEHRIVSVYGHPRESDPKMYDIEITVSEQQTRVVSVNTFGLVTTPIRIELVRFPASSSKVLLDVSARYDSTQRGSCLAELDGTCLSSAPFEDPSWLTSGDGSKAELVVGVSVIRNGEALIERSVAVPFAGQLIP